MPVKRNVAHAGESGNPSDGQLRGLQDDDEFAALDLALELAPEEDSTPAQHASSTPGGLSPHLLPGAIATVEPQPVPATAWWRKPRLSGSSALVALLAIVVVAQAAAIVVLWQRARPSVPVAAASAPLPSSTPAAPLAGAATTGRLQIDSEPRGATVTIDDKRAGVTPLTVPDLEARSHTVAVALGTQRITRTVAIDPAATVSLVVVADTNKPAASVSTGGTSAGGLSVASAAPLQILEGGQVVGTSEARRILLPAGRHDLEFVNEALGFRTRRSVFVVPGATASVRVELPNGIVNINAAPWAEVWLDGRSLGQTPLGNVSVPIGTHEVIFRHPQFGERKATVTVTANGPARIAVDLRK
jgi:hypothetical protein